MATIDHLATYLMLEPVGDRFGAMELRSRVGALGCLQTYQSTRATVENAG